MKVLGYSIEAIQKITSNLGKTGDLSPRQMVSFNRLMVEAEGESIISIKKKELINVALAVATECYWSINLQVVKALEHGASNAEIIEATWVAILMVGRSALKYALPVLDARAD